MDRVSEWPSSMSASALDAIYRRNRTTEAAAAVATLPSEVNEHFRTLYAQSPRKATEWFFSYSKDVGYICTRENERDLHWTSPTRWGELEISVNLAKPEKDPADIAAARTGFGGTGGSAAGASDIAGTARDSACDTGAGNDKRLPYPACVLCMENEGYPGRPTQAGHSAWPDKSELRIVQLELAGESWGFQFSPYAYFDEHCIVMSREHRPMHIDRSTLANLLALCQLLPHYFFGSNADLPLVGGSILAHDHYQGGRKRFSMQRAPLAQRFTLARAPDVQAGIVSWPVSVVRLSSENKEQLLDAAEHVVSAWRVYSDEQAGIYAFDSQNGEPHNTVTPIASLCSGRFTLELALRCNATSAQHPLGVFHPHAELHHVKRENIGLIEVMGLAILPPRLLEQMPDLACNRQRQQEVAEAFCRCLEHCGVFKWDKQGDTARMRFIEALREYER